MYCHVWLFYSYVKWVKEFKTTACQMSGWHNGLRRQVGKQGVAGYIPVGDLFSILNFRLFHVPHRLWLGGCHGWFHLHGLIRVPRIANRSLQNEQILPTEDSISRPLDYEATAFTIMLCFHFHECRELWDTNIEKQYFGSHSSRIVVRFPLSHVKLFFILLRSRDRRKCFEPFICTGLLELRGARFENYKITNSRTQIHGSWIAENYEIRI